MGGRVDRRQREQLGAPRDVVAAALHAGVVRHSVRGCGHRRLLWELYARVDGAMDATGSLLSARAQQLRTRFRTAGTLGVRRRCRGRVPKRAGVAIPTPAIPLHAASDCIRNWRTGVAATVLLRSGG